DPVPLAHDVSQRIPNARQRLEGPGVAVVGARDHVRTGTWVERPRRPARPPHAGHAHGQDPGKELNVDHVLIFLALHERLQRDVRWAVSSVHLSYGVATETLYLTALP